MSAGIGRIVTKGVAWISASSVAAKFIGLAYSILLLSNLSVYEYGVTELVLSIPGLLSLFSLPGMYMVVAADMSNEKARGDTRSMSYILNSFTSILTILGILGCLVMLGIVFIAAMQYDGNIKWMIAILSLMFLLGPIRSRFIVIFQVSLDYRALAIQRLCSEVIKLCLVAIGLIVFKLGPLAVIIAYLASEALTIVIQYPRYRRVKKKLLGNVKNVSGWYDPLFMLKAHGKWSIFGSYVDSFSQNIRPWLIKFFLGTHAVALYAVALGMFQNTNSLVPISQVITPAVPRYLQDKPKLYQFINSSVKYQLIASFGSGVLMAAAMPILIYWFFPQYAESYPLFVLILAGSVPSSFSAVYHSVFLAMKAQKNLFYSYVMRLILTLVCLPLSLHFVGLYGIALEFFITRTIYSYNRYKQVVQLLPEYVLNVRDVFRITDMDKMLFRQLTEAAKKYASLSK